MNTQTMNATPKLVVDGVAMRPELNLDDGMHPNARGVDAIVQAILPMVERMVAEGGGKG